MTRDGQTYDIGHPAPGRVHTRDRWLWFGFFGGAVAWSLQLAINGSLAGLACLGDRATPDIAMAGWTRPTVIAVNLGALAIAAIALAVAAGSLRKARKDQVGEGKGVIGAGEGRARFMSVWGILASTLFLGAIAFNTISVFWSGLCLD